MTIPLAVFIFTVTACAFVVKGLVGFGDPLISNPVLALYMESRDITPGLLPVSLIMNAYIVLKNRKEFSIRAVTPIAVWVLLGIIPGSLLLKIGAPWILKAVLGVYIIGLGVEMLTRDKAKLHKPNMMMQSIVSFLSGVSAGLFGINLLFLIYMERTARDRKEFRASICFVFLLENAVRFFVYIYNDIFTILSLQMTAICIPASVIGVWIGSKIDTKLSEEKLRRIIVCVFILGGMSALIKALTQAVV